MDQQALIEKQQVEDGRQRFWKKIRNYVNLGETSKAKWGVDMLNQAVPVYAKAMHAWVNDKRTKKAANYSLFVLISDFLPEQTKTMAFLGAKEIINGVSQGEAFTSLAISVANSIELEILCRKAKKQIGSVEWRKISKAIQDNNFSDKYKDAEFRKLVYQKGMEPFLSLKAKVQIGTVMLHLFKGSTGIIDFVNLRSGNNKMKTFVTLSDEARYWVEAHTGHFEILRPVRYPMIQTPEPWLPQTLFSGGYNDEKIKLPLLKSHNQIHKKLALETDMPVVIEAVNAMQSVPWRVNKEVLNVVETYFSEKRSLNDILPFHGLQDLPPKPHDIDSNELSRREWRRKAQSVYQQNYKNKSKFLLIAKILQTARQFSQHDKLFFPCQLDFRGRMYYSNEVLHPQGNDLSRGLLEFTQIRPIETEDDARWLAINGANKFGIDKVSFDLRVKWVKDNQEKILNVLDDPIGFDWWTQADKPWQFLAWCFDYARYIREGYGYLSRLPCSLDGTNNGLQILSLLTGDRKTAELTNVLPNEDPQDVYDVVRKRVIELLLIDGGDMAVRLIKSKMVRREVVKVPVMALPYGIKPHGAMEAVDAAFRKISFNEPNTFTELPENMRRDAALFLTKTIREAIGQLLVEPIACMNWLKDVSRIVAESGQPVKWITPSGFPVCAAYIKTREITVSTRLDATLIDNRCVVEETKQINDKAIIRAISANFVHSLDASIAHLVCCKAQQSAIHFAIVHDCFVAHASDLARLAEIVKSTYVSVFTENQLLTFYKQLVCQNPKVSENKFYEVRDFPVDQIMHSNYFLS
jgi:DNA-directed RNA polymerase, mitochondrial